MKKTEGLSIKKPGIWKNRLLKIGNPALKRHRQWLEEFKLRMRQKKNEEEAKDKEDLEKYERVIKNYATIIIAEREISCFQRKS